MVLSIKTNISALTSLKEMREGAAATRKTFAKISSGSRITTARDDASGLAISNNLRLNLASAKSALSNIKQATSVLQIADSGLKSMQGKIERMSEIAAMASSDNLSNEERAYLDAEFQLLKDGISADINSTTYNGENLLGERPEYALGPVGNDLQTDDGVVGFQFDNDGLFQNNDIFDFTYDSATNVFQIENTNTSYRESIQGPVGGIAAGRTFDLDFDKIGIKITISSDFDFATDIDPAVQDANFIVRTNDPNAPAFIPSDLTNLVQNISPEDGTVNIIGGAVQSVGDLEVTGGNNSAFQGTPANRPTLDFGGVFGRDALVFDGVNDYLRVNDSASINLGTFQERSIAMSFETGADIGTTQVLYEEGANVNGLNIYVQGGQLYMGVYRGNGSQRAFVNTPIAANTQYTMSMDFNSNTNTFTGYLNGVAIATIPGIGAALPSHSGDIGLGGIEQQTRLHDGTLLASGANFGGKIGDFLLYNDSFTAADHGSLDTYLRNAAGPATAGFSNEQMAFQIDHAQGEQLIYKKAQTDFLEVQIAGLNVLTLGSAQNAVNELRAATDFISTERSKIGGLLSQLEYASNQVSTFEENTLNANSVIRDADLAAETTTLASDVLRDRVNILTLQAANEMGGRLLALLEG